MRDHRRVGGGATRYRFTGREASGARAGHENVVMGNAPAAPPPPPPPRALLSAFAGGQPRTARDAIRSVGRRSQARRRNDSGRSSRAAIRSVSSIRERDPHRPRHGGWSRGWARKRCRAAALPRPCGSGATATGEHTAGHASDLVVAREHASNAVVVYACERLHDGGFLAASTRSRADSIPWALPPFDAAARILLRRFGHTVGAPGQLIGDTRSRRGRGHPRRPAPDALLSPRPRLGEAGDRRRRRGRGDPE